MVTRRVSFEATARLLRCSLQYSWNEGMGVEFRESLHFAVSSVDNIEAPAPSAITVVVDSASHVWLSVISSLYLEYDVTTPTESVVPR